MILIYFDESGINYEAEDGLFKDGPFLIMGAMCVREDVYWNMERLFSRLIDNYFGIGEWLEHEIHATDIWFGKDLSKNLTDVKKREFLQLCGKFGLPYIFVYNLKNTKHDFKEKNLNMLRTAYCLLLNIEHKLAEMHQTGVLIADACGGSEKLQTKDILSIDMKAKGLTSAQALLKQFHEMTSWRTRERDTKGDLDIFTIKPKYPMEAMSAYLIDRVHFLPSNDSLFLQMCDILTFTIQRALVHDYLLIANKSRISPKKIPFTESGLSMIRNTIHASYYDFEKNDVAFYDAQSAFEEDLRHGKSSFIGLPGKQDKEIIDHYNQMQKTS